MDKSDLKPHYQLLEVNENCSFEELLGSYKRLKSLYNKGSLAMLPLDDEIDDEERNQYLSELENSFKILSRHYNEKNRITNLNPSDPSDSEMIECKAFSGPYFRAVRKNLGMDLQQISFVIKVSRVTLENIEDENFHKLPHPTYLKCLVKAYAGQLGLDPKTAASEYMERFTSWERKINFTY